MSTIDDTLSFRKLLRLASLVIFFRMGRAMLSFIIGVLRVEWVDVSKLPGCVLDLRLGIAGDDNDDPTTDLLRDFDLRPSFILGVLLVEWFEVSKLPDDEARTLGFRLVITGGDSSTSSM
jgi:hypothetical protein